MESIDAEKQLDFLSKATKKHCAAFFWGDHQKVFFRKEESGESYVFDQGTITFVEYQDKCFGITNNHVVEKHVSDYSGSFYMALDKHTPLPAFNVIFRNKNSPDYPPDIAILKIEKNVLLNGGKTPYDLSSAIIPFDLNTPLFVVGFPAQLRDVYDCQTAMHPLSQVVCTCRSITDQKLILHDSNPQDMRKFSLRGMSGGAIFSADDYKYTLVGILYEGTGYADDLEDENTIHPDIWIFGFPLTVNELSKILDEPRELK